MRLFKKKSPIETEAPAAAAPAEEAQHDLKPSRFSFRRNNNSNGNEATIDNDNIYNHDASPTNYNAMEENRAGNIELTKKSNDDSSSSSIATEEVGVTPEMSWFDFICLWGWCAVPCVVYILLFTVSCLRDFHN